MFSAITFLALAALYVYVAPGLQTRLLSDQLSELTADAQHHSAAIARTVGSNDPLPVVQTHVNAAALATGDRVTLLLVNHVPSGAVLSELADSSRRSATAALSFAVAKQAVAASRMITGTEETGAGTVAEAANPVLFHGRVAAVIVYSAPASDIVRTVATVRHQILVAGGIALLLALVGSWLMARALAQRVKRLELAAEQVAAGDFGQPIPVDSSDELGAARGGVQPDAAPALPARVGAQEVHRDRVARAPHPDLFAGWVRRAARRSRPRSGDAGAVLGAGPRPGGTAAQAVGGPA